MLQYDAGSEENASKFARELGGAPILVLPPYSCLAPGLRRYQFMLLGEQRHTCVNNLPGVARGAERPGLEPYNLSVVGPTL